MSFSGKNIPGNVQVIDLPIAAGATSVSYVADRALTGLIYIGIQARGAESITPTIAGVTGATVVVTDGFGAADAVSTNGVLAAQAGVGQENATAVGYENLAPLGTVQSSVEDKTYVAPASTTTPLGATIASGATIAVAIGGTVAVWETLPSPDVDGYIVLPTPDSNVQAGWTDLPADSVPFRVKATDTQADTFAGVVRLVFANTVKPPTAPTGNTVTNGVNTPGAGVGPTGAAAMNVGQYKATKNTYTTVTGATGAYTTYA